MLSRYRYLEAEGLSLEGVSEKLRLFGENSVDVKPPTFWHHLGERLTSPFVVFSLFNQVVSCVTFREIYSACSRWQRGARLGNIVSFTVRVAV